MITTSRSAVATWQSCPRKRYLAYEAANGAPDRVETDGDGTYVVPATRGWERKALAIPLVTGIYVHKGLESALQGEEPAGAASRAAQAYLTEVKARGLQVEVGTDEAAVVEEQAAHVEALVLAWCRVRLPKWLEEYEIVEVEAEDRVPLADDVTLAVRADAIVRRKADGRMFIVNFKTAAQTDERWLKGWEIDMQLMTELLAAERRHGHEFGGVIIEGLIKGRRVQEKDNVGTTTGYRDTTPLLYGYKVDPNPPLTQGEYLWEYTRRKGFYRFPTWKEAFPSSAGHSALSYWIHWLPEEVVEAQFTVVPPIMRSQEMIDAKVRQIVGIESTVQAGLASLEVRGERHALDAWFPQNEHSCLWPSKCPMYAACWEPGTREDMAGSGLYQPRRDHHAVEGASE